MFLGNLGYSWSFAGKNLKYLAWSIVNFLMYTTVEIQHIHSVCENTEINNFQFFIWHIRTTLEIHKHKNNIQPMIRLWLDDFRLILNSLKHNFKVWFLKPFLWNILIMIIGFPLEYWLILCEPSLVNCVETITKNFVGTDLIWSLQSRRLSLNKAFVEIVIAFGLHTKTLSFL